MTEFAFSSPYLLIAVPALPWLLVVPFSAVALAFAGNFEFGSTLRKAPTLGVAAFSLLVFLLSIGRSDFLYFTCIFSVLPLELSLLAQHNAGYHKRKDNLGIAKMFTVLRFGLLVVGLFSLLAMSYIGFELVR